MKIGFNKSLITFVSIVAISLSGCVKKRGCEIDNAINHQSIQDIEVAKLQNQIASTDVIVEKNYQMFPPNAEAGECYTRVMIPEKYEILKQKVLVKEASTKLIKIPAKYKTVYKTVYKKVLVKEASTKLVTTKPVYKSVTQKVLVGEPSSKVLTTKPVYKTVTQRVLVAPAHTEWKLGKQYIRNALRQRTNATGEIICLVKVPARYKLLTKRVLVKPACSVTKSIPAKYKLITKKVLVKPACTKTVTVPAVYKKVATTELVSPACTKTVTIPAEYRYINKKIKVKDSELKWLPVLCETNFTRPRIMMVQRALKEAGFNPGPIDGIIGSKTKAAIRRFQLSHNLATGALTLATLRELGVYN